MDAASLRRHAMRASTTLPRATPRQAALGNGNPGGGASGA